MELPGFFVALFLDDDTHITLCIRKQCTVEDLQKMIDYLRFDIASLLPLAVRISPGLTMKGIEKDVPTHDVYFMDGNARETISKIYSDMIDDDSPFPNWSPHVTVDTREKEKTVNQWLERTGGLAVLKDAQLRQLKFKDVIFRIQK